MDEDIHGIGFAYEARGSNRLNKADIKAVLNLVAPSDFMIKSQRATWVNQYFDRRSCSAKDGGGGGGGGLSNILPRRDRGYGPPPTLTPHLIVQYGVKMQLTCKAGIYILFLETISKGR